MTTTSVTQTTTPSSEFDWRTAAIVTWCVAGLLAIMVAVTIVLICRGGRDCVRKSGYTDNEGSKQDLVMTTSICGHSSMNPSMDSESFGSATNGYATMVDQASSKSELQV